MPCLAIACLWDRLSDSAREAVFTLMGVDMMLATVYSGNDTLDFDTRRPGVFSKGGGAMLIRHHCDPEPDFLKRIFAQKLTKERE